MYLNADTKNYALYKDQDSQKPIYFIKGFKIPLIKSRVRPLPPKFESGWIWGFLAP